MSLFHRIQTSHVLISNDCCSFVNESTAFANGLVSILGDGTVIMRAGSRSNLPVVNGVFRDTIMDRLLQELHSALPALPSITLVSTKRSFSWFYRDALSFVETVVRFASNIDIFIVEFPITSPIRSTWRRIGGVWNLSHRERQGILKQEHLLRLEHDRELPAWFSGVFRT